MTLQNSKFKVQVTNHKFKILFLIPFLFFINQGKSQESFEVFLNGGLDNSNIVKEGSAIGSALINPFGGIEITSPALFKVDTTAKFKNFRLALNAGASIRGSDINEPRYKHRFNYADIALKPKFTVINAFDVYFGGQVSYLISHFKVNAEDLSTQDFIIQNPSETQISGIIGLEMDLGPDWKFELGYRHGITAIEDNFRYSWLRLGLQYRLTPSEAEQKRGKERTNKENFQLKEAIEHIKNLKNGLLLVRLTSNLNTIKSLRKKGNTEKANEIINKTKTTHYQIMRAFKDTFNFCKVGLFYDYETEKILNKKWGRNVFSPEGHYFDSTVAKKYEHFYILDLGEVFLPDEHQSFNGLVIRDKNLTVLKAPFPNKVESQERFTFLGLNKPINSMIAEWENALWNFYREHTAN